MKILAIEASSLVASAAILNDDVITAEYTVNNKITHSQTLLPMIDDICKMTETTPSEFDAIAVSSGPGSFTGLRIGSATAKGLAMVLNIPIIHVPTIEAMAYNLYGYGNVVCPVMDARRNQVYTGAFEFLDGQMITLIEDCAISVEELFQRLNEIGKKVTFIGDGIPVIKSNIDNDSSAVMFEYEYAKANANRQRAASVAVLGASLYEQGIMETSEEHLPDYFRKSQAERELEEKMKNE